MRPRRGFTLIELMISLGILVMIAIGAAKAYEVGVTFQTKVLPERERLEAVERAQDKIRRLVQSAYLSSTSVGTTYLIAFSGNGGMAAQTTAADTLIFTTAGVPPSGRFLASAEDFDSRNELFGPQGGVAEVAISMYSVGEAGEASGPYLREQRPADGDAYQGGYERALDDLVTSISFEFYDGTAWVPEWDSNALPEPRLPAAVRVTYQLQDEEASRMLIVRLPLSDVTPENPAATGLGGGEP
jgi:prepilin-type N-terminal cleavage/methylation domain-containing protein